MKLFKKIITLLIITILALAITVVFKTLQVPNLSKISTAPAEQSNLFPDAISNLSKAIQIKTVSDTTSADYNHDNFKKFIKFLSTTYPNLSNKLHLEIINDSMLFKWDSHTDLPGVVVMAHYDTVPVEPADLSKWTTLPFAGEVAQNRIWGRGAIDDKGNLIAILEAVNHLIKQGFMPKRDIYIALGADEEIGGTNGNKLIVEHLLKNNVKIAAIYDEGVPIMKDFMSFVDQPIATISIAEKGYVSFLLTSHGISGHSSFSAKNNAIARLAQLIAKIDAEEQPTFWPDTLSLFLQGVTPYSNWPYKALFANMWLTKPLISYSLANNQMTQSLVKTIAAITKFNAGIKDNVIPTQATAIVNYRLIHGETVTNLKARLDKLAKPLDIEVNYYSQERSDPIAPSPIDNIFYESLKLAINKNYSNVVVVPGTMIAISDSRHYRKLTPNIYRFTPFMVTPLTVRTIHGINESLDVDDFIRGIQVYTDLIRGVTS